MKALRHIIITLLLAALCFSTVTYMACKKNKCNNIVCQNGGSCNNGVCSCPSEYTGTLCEKGSCVNVNCLNGGACVSGTCNCANGYEGERCELTNKYIGTYTAVDSCSSSPKYYSVIISMNPTGTGDIIKITNIGNITTYIYATLSSDQNSFTINATSYEGYHYQGGGNFSNDTIYAGYTVTIGSSFTSCTGVWVKD